MGCRGAHLTASDVEEPQQQQKKSTQNTAAPPDPVQHSKTESLAGPRVAGTSGDVAKSNLPTLPPPPVIKEKSKDSVRSLPELLPSSAMKEGEIASNGRPQNLTAKADMSNARQDSLEPPQPPKVTEYRADRFESMPGAICTTPRGSKPQESTRNAIGDNSKGKAHVNKAFDALESSASKSQLDLGKALAALGDECDDEELGDSNANDKMSAMVEVVPLLEGTSQRIGSPIPHAAWPKNVQVSSSSRVLVLTWARWARNSLRIKEEHKFKALQHIKYPKTPYRPLSPQATPRATPCGTPRGDASDLDSGTRYGGEDLGNVRLPAAPDFFQSRSALGSSKRHPATASRNRGTATQERLLFDVMAEERREASEAEGVRLKLEKMAIEGKHTESSNKTPGFGIETPNFLEAKTSASRLSPMDSVVSSGVGSPLAAGQLSPWLLEAEALVNEDEQTPNCPPPTRSKAWVYAPSQLFDLPESSQLELDEEMDDFIDDDDELDRVVVFNTAGLSGSSFHGPSGSDSLSSTATSPAMLGSVFGGTSEKHQKYASNSAKSSMAQYTYAVGEHVSYWSGSRGIWLPAVVMEKKSDNVYLIDKQMKGCLAKVRASDLISREEEKQNPILAAFATLERDSSSTPRGSKSPHKTGSTPRGSRSQPTGEKASSRPGSNRGNTRELPPLQHERTSPRNALMSKSPPALENTASRSPVGTPRSRGKIVRDDFSDDSDDD